MLEALERVPTVAEVLIVVGHAAERIDEFLAARSFPFATSLVANPKFDSANNIYSAKLLGGSCRDGFLLVNSDVFCDSTIVAEALGEAKQSFLVVDASRPIRDEAMKVRFDDDRLVAIGKHLDAGHADGEYIGLARFDAAGAAAFFDAVEEILRQGGEGEWYEAAIGRAAQAIAIGSRRIGDRAWIEIDDVADLARARDVVLPRIRRSKLAAGFASGGS
jgi:choline kinase